MAIKIFEDESMGLIHVQKRRGAKNIRLSINHSGKLKVSIPFWLPYKSGFQFALQKKEWILSKSLDNQSDFIKNGDKIGKLHTIIFTKNSTAAKPRSRITKQSQILITHPANFNSNDPSVQAIAKQAAIRSLKQQAKLLFPSRLEVLAKNNGFEYNSLTIKQLTGRWGSCSSNKDIVLNCFLIQLPWYLIDYVIMHELVHTKIMAHGSPFWTEMTKHVPDLPKIRKEIKQYKPIVLAH